MANVQVDETLRFFWQRIERTPDLYFRKVMLFYRKYDRSVTIAYPRIGYPRISKATTFR